MGTESIQMTRKWDRYEWRLPKNCIISISHNLKKPEPGHETKIDSSGTQTAMSGRELTGVPFTTVETWPGVAPSRSGTGASRDSPKSATLATFRASSSILLALISLWNMGGSASVCRYKIPLADPSAIRTRVGKSKGASDIAAGHKMVGSSHFI